MNFNVMHHVTHKLRLIGPFADDLKTFEETYTYTYCTCVCALHDCRRIRPQVLVKAEDYRTHFCVSQIFRLIDNSVYGCYFAFKKI